MIKKIILTLFFLCLFYSCNVYATEYKCAYDFTYSQGLFGIFKKNTNLEFTIDTEKKTITYPDGFFDKPVYFFDYYIDEKFTEEYIIESLNGGCPINITIGTIAFDDIFAYAIFFEESNFYRLGTAPAGYVLPTKFIESENVLGAITQIVVGEYNNNSSTGEHTNPSFGCSYYDEVLGDLKKLACRKNDSNCNSEQASEYNSKKKKLRSFCNIILKNNNVNLSNCLDSCLLLNKEISQLEGDFNTGQCGFSERLILWIANIIRWVKYIVPVAVIVLGILDFIKAIGADKEDVMKKSQQRFIKRLIAAGLVFIAPFIIEFILNKMGFSANGCGIINL